jgi:glyoxylase-like metal-dependent hydrolase (beta-lactamase superfamily II)
LCRNRAAELRAKVEQRAAIHIGHEKAKQMTNATLRTVPDSIRQQLAASNMLSQTDPVLDFDPRSGSTRTTSADRLLKHIQAQGLALEWILDTHPHEDHFSAAGYLKDMTGAATGIGDRVSEVQRLWKQIYNLPDTVPTDGSHWKHLFADGERFTVGEMEAWVLLSPGHTLCSVTYVIGNAAFVHDTVFMPDSGTARADFPGGDARQLWRIQRILQLPSETRLFTGHDYRPDGRGACWESTVAVQKANNLHLKNSDEAKFVKFRTEQDRSLPMPALILSALQVNLGGGRLPAPEADGRRYLKIPLNERFCSSRGATAASLSPVRIDLSGK